VIDQKSTVLIENGARLQTGLGRCAELPDARVHKVLVLSWSCRRSKLSFRPLQSFQPFVEATVCRYVLIMCHLIRSIPAYQLPPVVAEGADPLGDPCELPRGTPVVHSGATLDAAAKFTGIEHGLPDHLEDVALKDMRGDRGVPAAFNLRSVVVVLSRAAIAAVCGVMIHGNSPRGAHNLLPSSKGRTPTAADPALDEAAQKVVRGGLAISRIVLP
jgi:hypothetical protein